MPGATLTTRLNVYDTPTPDGQIGGTPHMHLLCSEMYFVTKGSGFVEMIDYQGFSRIELKTHSALIFSPGTIHRLINPERDLELFIIMQNSGLPERGDNVVSFTQDIMHSAEAYAKAMKAGSFAEAYRRRDQGVEGFLELKAAFALSLEKGRERLEQFFTQAVIRTQTLRQEWESTVIQGALAEAQRSLKQVEQLNQNQPAYLQDAQHFLINPGDFKTPGFCGALNRYFDPKTLELEGKLV